MYTYEEGAELDLVAQTTTFSDLDVKGKIMPDFLRYSIDEFQSYKHQAEVKIGKLDDEEFGVSTDLATTNQALEEAEDEAAQIEQEIAQLEALKEKLTEKLNISNPIYCKGKDGGRMN